MNEIEKKFLLKENEHNYTTPEFRNHFGSVEELAQRILVEGNFQYQAYLPPCMWFNLGLEMKTIEEVRVRGESRGCSLTAKGPGDITREEEIHEISEETFLDLFKKAESFLKKDRLKESIRGYQFEFDLYYDRNLLVAECEVESEELLQHIPVIGKDVTEDPIYKNVNLAIRKYS